MRFCVILSLLLLHTVFSVSVQMLPERIIRHFPCVAQMKVCSKIERFNTWKIKCYKEIEGMIRGIIFDFDGVITDSEPPYIEALVKLMKSLGRDASFEELQHVVGQNLKAIGEELTGTYGLDMSAEEFNERCMRIYEESTDIRDFRAMDGLYDFLESCKQKGIIMCVASSSDYDYLYTIMDSLGIRDYFAFVLSGHGLRKGKPDPLIYNMAAEKMGIDKKDLLIIEDSTNGIRAGKASGIYTVGFKGSKVVQDTSMADKEVYSFQEIEL